MHHRPLRSPSSSKFRHTFALLATAAAGLAAHAADAPSRIHALLNVEFSDKYLTPRGMIVQDKGLTTQVLFLGLVNLHNGHPPIPSAA